MGGDEGLDSGVVWGSGQARAIVHTLARLFLMREEGLGAFVFFIGSEGSGRKSGQRLIAGRTIGKNTLSTPNVRARLTGRIGTAYRKEYLRKRS